MWVKPNDPVEIGDTARMYGRLPCSLLFFFFFPVLL